MADTRSIIAGRATVNTPSIGTNTTVMAANTNRAGWFIQNLGTNVMYVCLGSGASSSVFHFALKAGTTIDDGTGASTSQTAGAVYTGLISASGTGLRYTYMELT